MHSATPIKPTSKLRILKSKNLRKIEKILGSYDQRDLAVEGVKMSSMDERSEMNGKGANR